jgi:hypothetical protein
MVQTAYDARDTQSGCSSNTTTDWPLVIRMREAQFYCGRASLSAGDSALPRRCEIGWGEAVEEVLEEYADAWRELAAR